MPAPRLGDRGWANADRDARCACTHTDADAGGPRPTATPLETWTGPRTFTFVALGVDQRNEQEIPRTDTIMIGKADLSHAARQPGLDPARPDRGYPRLRPATASTAAYVYGELYKEPGGGIGLLQAHHREELRRQRRSLRAGRLPVLPHHRRCRRRGQRERAHAIVDTQYPTDDYGIKIGTLRSRARR